jgi:hypothetical protein
MQFDITQFHMTKYGYDRKKTYEIAVLPILTSCMGFYSHAKRGGTKGKKNSSRLSRILTQDFILEYLKKTDRHDITLSLE